jgi:hypothetical protein
MSDAGKEDGVAGWMRGASIGLKVRWGRMMSLESVV